MKGLLRFLSLACVLGASLDAEQLHAASAGGDAAGLPPRLSETGLYAPGPGHRVRADLVSFAPQYPLWSDGATKRRWMSLPPGTAIDGSDPDAWDFPPGTRFWKEFAVDGRPVETRMLTRMADGRWRYAAYAWEADGGHATLVSPAGTSVRTGAGGRYVIPSESDCRACHEGAASPVLGFSALQLSPDRDPNAIHAENTETDLRSLVASGLLRNLPATLLARPPRIEARSVTERSALGYLHANCGHCHNTNEAGIPVSLDLAQDAMQSGTRLATRREGMASDSRYRLHDAPQATRLIAPGQADASMVSLRMRTRDPLRQMPPLGTEQVDLLGVELIDRWIETLPPAREQRQ